MEKRVISEFSERILEAIKDHEAAFPGPAGFVVAIEEARKTVDSAPPAFSFTFHQNPSPAAMGSDPTNVFPRLLAETEGWLGIVVHSVAFRLGHFLDDLVTGLLSRQRCSRMAARGACAAAGDAAHRISRHYLA
jgi:hypothetical protein